MSQCVPNWDLDDSSVPTRLQPRPHHPNSSATSTVVPPRYEIAELTWENGQLSMHGLGPPRVHSRHASDRQRAAPGTLESIVNLATQKPATGAGNDSDVGDLVPWFDRNGHRTPYRHHQPSSEVSAVAQAAATVTMDALVPSQATNEEEGEGAHVLPRSQSLGTCKEKGRSAPRVPVAGEKSKSGSVSVSRSGTVGGDSRHVPTLDTCEKELGGFGLTSTSFCSQGNTVSISSGRPATATNNTTTVDDHDSVCHSTQRETSNVEGRKKGTSKSSLSTKRSRAAAIHNQSERKRRDKINQKMKTLQKMVPNSSKTDKASMLDEVIDYLKQLQAQVNVISRMSMQSMMMPLAMQQQLHMSMMNPMAHAAMGMGMGMGVGMGMDVNMNPMARPNLAGLPQVMNPTGPFMPMVGWDGAGGDGRGLPSQAAIGPTDPLSTYLASQSQPVTMEAYSRMIAIMQQQQQQQHQASASKN